MKSIVTIKIDDKEYITHNDFMPAFMNHLAGWMASSTTVDKSSFPSPKYMAIGIGNTSGDRLTMESEVLRVPIDAKFVEPISQRTRYITSFKANDISSIGWGEIGLFDSSDHSILLNKCDALGQWKTGTDCRLYASQNDCVHDEGALFCEFPISTASLTLFSTLDLSDGSSSKVKNATSTELNWRYLAHSTSSTKTATNPVTVGQEDGSSGLYRSAIMFDLTDLPLDVKFTRVSLAGTVSYLNPTAAINIGPYNSNAQSDPTSDIASDFFNRSASTDLSGGTISSLYINAASVVKIGTFDVDLGTTAVSDLQSAFAGSKTFALGITEDHEAAGERFDLRDMTLKLEYTRDLSLGINAKTLGKDSDFLQFFLFLNRIDAFITDTIIVDLSSSETEGTHQWEWEIRPSSMSAGWNFIQLPLGEATITGSPNTTHMKRFKISVDGSSVPGIAGLDNIRLFRNNGTLMNRVVLGDKIVKSPGAAVTVQWLIDLDSGT